MTLSEDTSSASSDTMHETLIANATGPKKVETDAGTVEQHDPSELIAVDRYLASKRQTQSAGWPMRMMQIRPDGM